MITPQMKLIEALSVADKYMPVALVVLILIAGLFVIRYLRDHY